MTAEIVSSLVGVPVLGCSLYLKVVFFFLWYTPSNQLCFDSPLLVEWHGKGKHKLNSVVKVIVTEVLFVFVYLVLEKSLATVH